MENLVTALREILANVDGGYAAIAISVLYVLINILRGKAGFKVPFITNMFNKIKSKQVKTSIILGLFAIAGGLTTLESDKSGFWLFVDGMLGGLILGWTVLGARHQAKAAMESKTAQAFKDRLQSVIKKGDKKNENPK